MLPFAWFAFVACSFIAFSKCALSLCQSFIWSCVCVCSRTLIIICWTTLYWLRSFPQNIQYSAINANQWTIFQWALCACVNEWWTQKNLERGIGREKEEDKSEVISYCSVNVLDGWTFYHHSVRFIIKYNTRHTRAPECVRSRIRSHLMWISIIIKWWWFRTLRSLCRPLFSTMNFINRLRVHRIFLRLFSDGFAQKIREYEMRNVIE